MTVILARALIAIAPVLMGRDNQPWSLAMQAEFDVAVEDGCALSFAFGCFVAAVRELLMSASGRFNLTTHAIALGIIVPMAALQVGCALFDLPYLYPGPHGLHGAMLEGRSHEILLRGIYLRAIPALALIQLLASFGHVRLAWDLLERNWTGAQRWAI